MLSNILGMEFVSMGSAGQLQGERKHSKAPFTFTRFSTLGSALSLFRKISSCFTHKVSNCLVIWTGDEKAPDDPAGHIHTAALRTAQDIPTRDRNADNYVCG